MLGKCLGENDVQFYVFAQVLLAERATGNSYSPVDTVVDRPAPCLTHIHANSLMRLLSELY